MTTPRLEIDLDKIHQNARTLVERLKVRRISVTGVMKATLGSPVIGNTLLRAGVHALGDARIENIEALRRGRVTAPMMLLRAPSRAQADRTVAHADTSFNSEIDIIGQLSAAAQRAQCHHRVVLMVELGDLREGILPADLASTVRQTLRMPNISLEGIGTNLACLNGVIPDTSNMGELSRLADAIDARFGTNLRIVSGGNSASLEWALSGQPTGRINNLRLGESILLGCEPIHRRPIHGLHTDAIQLVAEVIESKVKPSQPWGERGQTAFGSQAPVADQRHDRRAILALGHQDTDPSGLRPPTGVDLLGATSDHLIASSNDAQLGVGAEVSFELNYSALLRSMTSPFVTKIAVPSLPAETLAPVTPIAAPQPV